MTNKHKDYHEECRYKISYYPGSWIHNAVDDFMCATTQLKRSYYFSWMRRPLIKYPQGVVTMQKLIWLIKPDDQVIEPDIAHG